MRSINVLLRNVSTLERRSCSTGGAKRRVERGPLRVLARTVHDQANSRASKQPLTSANEAAVFLSTWLAYIGAAQPA